MVNFVEENKENCVKFYRVLSLELTKKTTMVNFVSHVGSTTKFHTFFRIKFVRFRVKDQNEYPLLYIKDHFDQVKYMKDQNEHICHTLRTISIKWNISKTKIKQNSYIKDHFGHFLWKELSSFTQKMNLTKSYIYTYNFIYTENTAEYIENTTCW